MTGILPSTSGVYHNSQPWRPAMPKAVTLPQHFTQHGYWSAGSGKIYHGRYPDPASWQTYFPDQKKNKPTDPLPAKRPVNSIPKTAHFDWGPVAKPPKAMGDYQVADWIIGQLNREHDKPFFLACGIFRPHLPWYVPRKYFDLYPLDEIVVPKVPGNDLDDLPAAGLELAAARRSDLMTINNAGKRKEAIQAYLASISYADAQLGRILKTLEQSPSAANTIVVLWSDHGWHLGEKHHWHKSTLWEEATRVPLIIDAPGQPAGICHRPVSLLDLYPTLQDLCQLKTNQALDGVSLAPLLRDPATQWDLPAITEFKLGNAAVRSQRYRYIRYQDGSEELYDHQVDPQEWTNLASDNKYRESKRQLSNWIAKNWAPSAPTKKAFRFDPQTFTWTDKKTGRTISGKQAN